MAGGTAGDKHSRGAISLTLPYLSKQILAYGHTEIL